MRRPSLKKKPVWGKHVRLFVLCQMLRPTWLWQISPQTPIHSFCYLFSWSQGQFYNSCHWPVWRLLNLDSSLSLNTPNTPKSCWLFPCNRFNLSSLWGWTVQRKNSQPYTCSFYFAPDPYKMQISLAADKYPFVVLLVISNDVKYRYQLSLRFQIQTNVFSSYQILFFHVIFLL